MTSRTFSRGRKLELVEIKAKLIRDTTTFYEIYYTNTRGNRDVVARITDKERAEKVFSEYLQEIEAI